MDIKPYTIEVERKVFDNENGTHIKVRPSRNGLGLVEIDGGDEYGRIVVPPAHALLLADAIAVAAKEMLDA